MAKTEILLTIYAMRCKKNGKVYIGRTRDIETRIKNHIVEMRGNRKRMRRYGEYVPSDWQEDFNQYGEEAFEVFILEENVKTSDGKEREQHWIREYRANEPEFGYNMREMPSAVNIPVHYGAPPKKEDEV